MRDSTGAVKALAYVDVQDAELATHVWSMRPDGYVTRRLFGRKGKTLRLQREVVGLERHDPRVVDHIDGDPLNNRRSNLRVVTRGQNQQNRHGGYGTSRHRGVSWVKDRSKWTARVVLEGKVHCLGYYEDEDEAARVASEFRLAHMPYATS